MTKIASSTTVVALMTWVEVFMIPWFRRAPGSTPLMVVVTVRTIASPTVGKMTPTTILLTSG